MDIQPMIDSYKLDALDEVHDFCLDRRAISCQKN